MITSKRARRRFEAVVLYGVILFITVNFEITQGQSISSCTHNQFRCSDYGNCLRTEALCNGRRECQNGEDERGGGGWNCRSMFLAKDYCDPARQFRCRFGNCISRTSLCDGRIDCWGGSDEALDVCQGGKPKIPQVSGGSFNPPPPSSINQTPAPSRPIFTQPPAPPQYEQTTTRSQFPSQPSGGGGGGSGSCPAIYDDPIRGYKVICENSRFYELDCSQGVPPGANAQYTCQKYFTPTSSLTFSTSRRCENGRWTPLSQRFGCEAECGVSSSDTGAFIVGGSTAKAGRWPWMVAIYERSSRNPGKMDFICGASLISSKAIITAAHCVVRRDNGQTKSFGDLKIIVGKYYRNFDRKSTGEQEKSVEKVFVHPEYNRVTLRSDIAIIKLSDGVSITETVRPVCLPQPRDYTEPNQLGTLIGWGRGTGKAFQEQLQQAQLPVIMSQKCIDAHPQFAHLVHQGTFCAGYRNGTSACDGDSGGPLVFRDRFSPSKWLLHGVVSAGIASSDGRSGCNPNYYTVFTDVGFYTIRRWISFILESNFN